MAAFIALTSVQGEFTPDFGRELPDPSAFGLPTDDDGSRVDPLLSGASNAITAYRPDVAALTRRLDPGGRRGRRREPGHDDVAHVGGAGRGSSASELTVFPSNHGGFLGDEFGRPGSRRRSPRGCVRSSTARA